MFFKIHDVRVIPSIIPYPHLRVETTDENYDFVKKVMQGLKDTYGIPISLVSEYSGYVIQSIYQQYGQPLPQDNQDIKTCVEGVRYKNIILVLAYEINCTSMESLNKFAIDLEAKLREFQVGSIGVIPIETESRPKGYYR